MNGKLVIVSAPSGAGKTTIVHRLMEAGLGLEFSVSACSRPKRAGEKHGVDYYFISISEFRDRIGKGEFLEWQEVYPDHFYGTLRSEVDRIWKTGRHVIFDVDVEGGINLKKIFSDRALSLFILPPSLNILEERLRKRSTDNEMSISTRLQKAEKEIKRSGKFDRIILNDDLERAVKEAIAITKEFLNKK